MKWPKRDQQTGSGGGSNLFLKLGDGESRVGLLQGERYDFSQKWEGGKPQVVGSNDPDGKLRFRANFVTKEDGEMKAKIFEFGTAVYDQLADLADEYDLTKTAIKITRRGEKLETTYTIIPAKEQPTMAQLKVIQSVDLNILEHKDSQKAASSPAEPNDGVPF